MEKTYEQQARALVQPYRIANNRWSASRRGYAWPGQYEIADKRNYIPYPVNPYPPAVPVPRIETPVQLLRRPTK
jgi:hypothetical protein